MSIKDYYQQQFIMEQEATRDMALRMQHDAEQNSELREHTLREMDEEKWEC